MKKLYIIKFCYDDGSESEEFLVKEWISQNPLFKEVVDEYLNKHRSYVSLVSILDNEEELKKTLLYSPNYGWQFISFFDSNYWKSIRRVKKRKITKFNRKKGFIYYIPGNCYAIRKDCITLITPLH
jgi:hypothetical protein